MLEVKVKSYSTSPMHAIFVKKSKALLSMFHMGWKIIYCILISCTVYDGMIARKEYIHDCVTFSHKSYTFNYLSNSWVVADKTDV